MTLRYGYHPDCGRQLTTGAGVWECYFRSWKRQESRFTLRKIRTETQTEGKARVSSNNSCTSDQKPFHRVPKLYNRKMAVFTTNGAKRTGCPHAKKKYEPVQFTYRDKND